MDNLEIKITAHDYKVLASGVFLARTSGENVIELNENAESITLRFVFEEDDTKKPNIKGENVNNNEIKVRFINFTNSNLGLGSPKPIKLGVFRGSDLFFAYRIYSLDDKSLMSFHYTFYAS